MAEAKKKGLFNKLLDKVEYAGNILPHPGTLFFLLAIFILLLSYVGSVLGWQALNPTTGKTIYVENLISSSGIHRIILEMVTNFTGFAPLGIVLVAMLGIGLADISGLISAVVRLFVHKTPTYFLTPVVILCGLLCQVGADVGYLLLIPLAGVIYLAVDRHPFVGIAAAFAGVSAGFGSNIVLAPLDSMLASLSQEAARIVSSGYEVNAMCNYFFQVASGIVIIIVGTIVTEKIIAPRFENKKIDAEKEELKHLTKQEKKGLIYCVITLIIIVAIIAIGIIPSQGVLRGVSGSILDSVLIKGVIAFIFIISAALGIVYGFTTGKFKNDSDIMNGMSDSIKTMALFIVIVFFAAQFVSYFKWSNLGEVIAIRSAIFLKSADLGTIPLITGFALLVGIVNLFMGSLSAKWALLAPIFVPMFMHLGNSPELIQAAYRVGDGPTNVISPMMFYFALIISYFQKYDKNIKMGTVISLMLPYTIVFFISLLILLIIFILLGIPLGPGVSIYYTG
jgi:aminobenzoyl-glutamate transport protein